MFDKSQQSFRDLGQIVGERSRPLLLWVGAGLSIPAGLPSWAGLREKVKNTLEAKIEAIGRVGRVEDVAQLKSLKGKLKAAESETFWVSFRILREALGKTSYESAIRLALAAATTAEVPNVYHALWSLRPAGLFNLNLDLLATKAFIQVNGAKTVVQFQGGQAGDFAYSVGGSIPFIGNLHGTYQDSSSWVLADDDLQRLMKTPGYTSLVRACAMNYTIFFAGITANDIAVGGHLERLRGEGISFANHFWITDKTDQATDQWAEGVGVRLIRYQADRSHSGLRQCIDLLRDYVPVEPPVEPIRPTRQTSGTTIPQPKDLLVLPEAEDIRTALNDEAVRILSGSGTNRYTDYQAFCKRYGEAINRAWYVNLEPGTDIVNGYQLTKQLGEGAFGTVYEAISLADPTGTPYALKLLHQANRSDPDYIQSFRRGVRSMSILSDAGVSGVVKYHDAFEIPPFVVMEYIPGDTLHDYLKSKQLDWGKTLDIATRLARILRDSHHLPQRVLHRDMRPHNVMIQNHWLDYEDWEIVVLDFDLSWHKDAEEKSITLDSYTGYVAPEQVEKQSPHSTRNFLIDSYGLGMTLFYLRTRVDPSFAQPARTDWQEDLALQAAQFRCPEWGSLPARYFRLIFHSTRYAQPERWDMTRILNELNSLQSAFRGGSGVSSPQMFAEEIMFKAFGDQYVWDPDQLTAVRRITPDARLHIQGDESGRCVRLDSRWVRTEVYNRAEIARWLPEAADRIRALLNKSEWQHVRVSFSTGQLSIEAEIPIEDLPDAYAGAAEALRSMNDLLIPN